MTIRIQSRAGGCRELLFRTEAMGTQEGVCVNTKGAALGSVTAQQVGQQSTQGRLLCSAKLRRAETGATPAG